MKTKKEIYKKLSEINVADWVDVKPAGKAGDLSYLSWALVHHLLSVTFDSFSVTTVYNEDNQSVWPSGNGGEVRVQLNLNGVIMNETLPIMNGVKPVLLTDITANDVNKAIQRCAVKAAARMGLGLNLYTKGQYLPPHDRIDYAMQPASQRVKCILDSAGSKTVEELRAVIKNLLPDEQGIRQQLIALAVAQKGASNGG